MLQRWSLFGNEQSFLSVLLNSGDGKRQMKYDLFFLFGSNGGCYIIIFKRVLKERVSFFFSL